LISFVRTGKKEFSNGRKIFVIGKGRFGTAAAQGLRESNYRNDDGTLSPLEVVNVSATSFTSLSPSIMSEQLQGSEYVVYCGYNLPAYAAKIAQAMKSARQGSPSKMEFIDFSNPDPINERDDVTGALDLWTSLTMYNKVSSKTDLPWTVWKITEVGSLDVAGTEGNSDGMVYKNGANPEKVPRIKIPNLTFVPAPVESSGLSDEAEDRIMERSDIDRWNDGMILGFAIFIFTSIYAIVRYNEYFNGSEPTEQIPMYLLDKSIGWTGLWMMVVSPYAGNMLALSALYSDFGKLPILDKAVVILSSLIMFLPTAFFFFGYVLWIAFRNIYFSSRGNVSPLYLGQFSMDKTSQWLKASFVDMVTLKGESGCVGFGWALIHSFTGLVCGDVAYKGYWFNETNGRLHARMELSMTTGCISTVLLWAVAMRSLFGKASWIKLKPLYTYASPIGMWFAVVHVMAFGAKGWVKLFKKEYHRGQLSITFVSSMYPAGILLVHHLMALFNTKRHISGHEVWRHSITKIATEECEQLRRRNGHHGLIDSWIKKEYGEYFEGGSTLSLNQATPSAA